MNLPNPPSVKISRDAGCGGTTYFTGAVLGVSGSGRLPNERRPRWVSDSKRLLPHEELTDSVLVPLEAYPRPRWDYRATVLYLERFL